MSNPWETNNPWGKGSKEWNRWMAPEGLEETVKGRSSKPVGQECAGVQIIRNADPHLPRYYSTHVVHFYYCSPGLSPVEWFGHFALSTQTKGSTTPLYYPAHGDYFVQYGRDIDAENPILENLTIKNQYLDRGSTVIRYSMRIEENLLFRTINDMIRADPSGNNTIGDSNVCVVSCKDLLNLSYLQWIKTPEILLANPEQLLEHDRRYLAYFPILRHAVNLPRDIFLATVREPYVFGVGGMRFDCEALAADKIFEVNVFEP
jgi:hypothetical protein